MTEIEELIEGLYDRNPNCGYACLTQLQEESHRSDRVYRYFDRFAEMLDMDNAYIRIRGLLLIAANARWDKDNKVDEIMERYLTHIMDVKPIVARQAIAALPEITQGKPELAEEICRALQRADPGRYQNSMAPLIEKDIAKALRQIKE